MSAESPAPVTSGEPERILIVDDDAANLQLLRQALDGRGYKLLVAKSGADALKVAARARPQLVLLDVMMPGLDGYETCSRLKQDEATRDAAVIFLSALEEASDKVRGFEVGAVDFITKPFQREEVLARVETHLTIGRLRRELEARNVALEHELLVARELVIEGRRRVEGALLGESIAVRALREAIREQAQHTEPVLLAGPPGAGHEAVARTVHQESARAGSAFIHVNCAMLQSSPRDTFCLPSADAAEAGPRAPAGQLALAAGGTLYLDGVNHLPPELQECLAEALGLRRPGGEPPAGVDVRIVAYSKEDLLPKAQGGGYHAGLADLLSRHVLRVPSLVERKDDIPVLVQHFVRKAAQRLGSVVEGVSEDSMRRLAGYRWPGNIPELESVLERAVLTGREARVEIDRALLAEGVPLGHYRLLRLLGKGAMGEVWLARHQLLARPAAVKLIRPESMAGDKGPAAVERFQREARATAKLSSPHTVRLYDFGLSETGAFYYVMELLHGMDLGALLKHFGPLPPERVVALLGQALRSLAEAHQAGLVHRDIKPANLFVCAQGLEHDFVKVLDFGIAKSLGTEGQEKLTASGAITGTPAFMAPELVLGGEVDARTDLYALGCVAWTLLTGRGPFGGELMEVLMHHVKTEPEAPSRVAGPAVPAGLDELILRCLQKQPKDRPESAPALARMLDEVELAEPWTRERANDWWHENLPELGDHAREDDDETFLGKPDG
jgi:DNA-binding NtrC family response regulator